MRGALIQSALLVIFALGGAAYAMLPVWTATLARLILLLVRSMP
ncbi:hypothetical protein [Novosphingobium sp. SG707]|nr:hypothetical protein [Novosphingobium sp. SG707]NKI99619.1 hypothetical protein [Novosphingobium sp. SG707]